MVLHLERNKRKNVSDDVNEAILDKMSRCSFRGDFNSDFHSAVMCGGQIVLIFSWWEKWCILIPSVRVLFLQLVRLGPPAQQYRPPHFFFFPLNVFFLLTIFHVGFEACTQLDVKRQNYVMFWPRDLRYNFEERSAYFELKKAVWKIFLANFIVRTVFSTYQTKKVSQKSSCNMHFNSKASLG